MRGNYDSRKRYLRATRRSLFSWLTLVITPESISDSISVHLKEDKETKMSQRQLNATSPHSEYNFLSEGRSPRRSGRQDPREAHLLWHRPFAHQQWHRHRANEPHNLRSELVC